jgi:hypothetical protein
MFWCQAVLNGKIPHSAVRDVGLECLAVQGYTEAKEAAPMDIHHGREGLPRGGASGGMTTRAGFDEAVKIDLDAVRSVDRNHCLFDI